MSDYGWSTRDARRAKALRDELAKLDPDGYLDAVGYTDPPVVKFDPEWTTVRPPPDPTTPERLGRWWRR
jgi:hypothetical protein